MPDASESRDMLSSDRMLWIFVFWPTGGLTVPMPSKANDLSPPSRCWKLSEPLACDFEDSSTDFSGCYWLLTSTPEAAAS